MKHHWRRPRPRRVRRLARRHHAPAGGRQALIDAIALNGFSDLAGALEAADASPMARMRAFLGIRDAFPAGDETHAEIAWSAMHGLAALQASGRLRPSHAQARLDLVHRMLAEQEALMRTLIEIVAGLAILANAVSRWTDSLA